MQTSNNSSECTCNLNLGIEHFSSHETNSDQERKYELVNEAIYFHGACNSTEKCKIIDKINEIKEKIGEYYFDKEKKLIAIPNQISLPKTPSILDPEDKDKIKKKANDKFLADYCESLLHQSLIKALRDTNKQAFIMKGFQSGDCIKAKLEKGKTLRIEAKGKCKSNKDCNCGKVKYPDLNIHEKEVMEILEIKNVEDEELVKCVRWLKEWKEDKESSDEDKTWLYNMVSLYTRYIIFLTNNFES